MKKSGLNLLIARSLVLLLVVIMFVGINSKVGAEVLTEYETEELEVLNIEVGLAEIEFVDQTDKIMLSPALSANREEEVMTIYSPETDVYLNWSLLSRWREEDKKYRILIGNQGDYSHLKFHLGGASLSGTCQVEEIDINALNLEVNGHLFADRIYIKGARLEAIGYINTDKLEFKGMGLGLNLMLENVQQVEIMGTGINGQLKYRDIWSGERDLSVTGLGGDLQVELARDLIITGNLNTSNRGAVNLNYEYIN